MKQNLLTVGPALPVLFLGTLALGQLPPSSPRPAPQAAVRAALDAAPLRHAPIHTQVHDPVFGAYGWWASHRDYKVSFHDGFVFYPYLGADYPENLPLRWTTTQVTCGGKPLVALDAPTSVHDDWRWEYRSDGFTEAYDVRDDGVEQTFVIARRPATAGDLVVAGRVTTALRASAVADSAQPGALLFADAQGRPIIRYGAAFAVDAAGDRTAVTTALAGDRVTLTVAAQWLASAVFPVTIDPLTSRVALNNTSLPFALPSIHREDESADYNVMVTVLRLASAGDYDIEAYLCRDDMSSVVFIWGDFGAGTSSLYADAAFVGGADRWVIGFWRHTAAEDRVRAYFHDKGSRLFNSGVLATNHNPGTEHASFSAVAGSSHPTVGGTGLMVYRADPIYGNSTSSVVWGVGLDAVGRQFTSQRVRVSRSDLDAESPAVTSQLGWTDNGWVVAYQGRTDVLDDHDIYLTRVSAGIGWMGEAQIGPDGLGDKARPVVEGRDGRYLVAMLQDVTPEIGGYYFGRNVYVERFDWDNNNGLPARQGFRLLESRANQEFNHLGLAFDGSTRSHWCLVGEQAGPRAFVRRLGAHGGVTEGLDLDGGVTGTYQPVVAWNSLRGEFPIVYCSSANGSHLVHQALQPTANAWHLVYGTSCGAGTIGSDTAPLAGSEFYRVNLAAAPPGQAAVLLLAGAAANLDLAGAGAANCFLAVTPNAMAIPCVSDGAGNASLTFALPDLPLFRGDLFWQYVYVWPARPHPLPIGVTRGLRARVE